MLDSRQREQLYTALKNAFSTILKFLHELSVSQSKLNSSDAKIKVSNYKSFITDFTIVIFFIPTLQLLIVFISYIFYF